MQIGDDYYEDLTPDTTIKILNSLAAGEKPKPGPQSGRRTSENSAGYWNSGRQKAPGPYGSLVKLKGKGIVSMDVLERKEPKPGPQSGRRTSENSAGLTT
jgi:hypothetical protein